MKKNFKNIMSIMVAVIIILSSVALFNGCKDDDTTPDGQNDQNQNETVKLSDYRGKVVLLNFWATWCGPCIDEMPDIQKLSETYSDDLIVLAVNCNEKSDKVNDFIKENGYTFNIALDEDGEIQKLYPTSGIPYTVIIDPNGIITDIQLGAGEDMFSIYEGYIKDALENQENQGNEQPETKVEIGYAAPDFNLELLTDK